MDYVLRTRRASRPDYRDDHLRDCGSISTLARTDTTSGHCWRFAGPSLAQHRCRHHNAGYGGLVRYRIEKTPLDMSEALHMVTCSNSYFNGFLDDFLGPVLGTICEDGSVTVSEDEQEVKIVCELPAEQQKGSQLSLSGKFFSVRIPKATHYGRKQQNA